MSESTFLRKLLGYQESLATVIRKIFGGSDLGRWSNVENLSPDWDDRTISIAKMVPANSRVLEFGAGRLVLRDHLPENCTYTPSDICDRGAGTIVCDLNVRPLQEFPEGDVIVFSGVLEYVNQVPEVIDHIKGSCDRILASYVCSSTKSKIELVRRRKASWVNDYDSSEFIELFTRAGFELVSCIDEKGAQKIYEFKKI